MGIDIRRNIYNPQQDMTFGAGLHLVLPQHNDSATPTLAFGDGDTGFYASADGVLQIASNGVAIFTIGATQFISVNANGPAILNRAVSAITPGFAPDRSDSDTGVGRAAADQLSLIAGATEGLRITTVSGVANMNIMCVDDAVVCHNDNVVTLN